MGGVRYMREVKVAFGGGVRCMGVFVIRERNFLCGRGVRCMGGFVVGGGGRYVGGVAI